MKDLYKITVIIPIYNQGKNIKKCISALKRQSVKFSNLEVILIDDGSTDNGSSVCENLAKKYFNIIYIRQENKGVSAARNQGIKIATGKYLFFLDADDVFSKNTIENVSEFFDDVYDEVDLVTYPIETVYKGRVLPPHFRYKYLVEEGIYDLNEYAYIGQTTMNIVVKNRFEDNIFFDEKQTFSEDQKYCCDVLARTLKMGFCKSGKYIYSRSDSSSSAKLAGACFIYEQCMKLFEELFQRYKRVPLAFQGLYVNDIYWKLLSNILFPYHYEEEAYSNAVERMRKLLKRCDNCVILEHPQFDYFEKFYLLWLKNKQALLAEISQKEFILKSDNLIISCEKSMEIVITKMKCEKGIVEIQGFIKSVFLQFYDQEVIVCAIENDGMLTRKLQLFDSAHCYYLSREKTQKFKAFRYRGHINKVNKVRFEVGFGCYWFPTHFYFMPQVLFSHKYHRYETVYQGCKWKLTKNNEIMFSEVQSKIVDRIWLYYDCVGVDKDNGYYQFMHDVEKKDDIKKYYIITDKKQRKGKIYNKYFVKFGSKKHKKLLEKCEKIFTAYIEESNIFPYDRNKFEKKADKFQAEIIYLQHGVLHIIMPWKFSPEKILADKIVISTEEERKLYLSNGFYKENLLAFGMPRFELANKAITKKKKILYAPSWRSYLTGQYINHKWEKMSDKFLNSTFFIGIQKFVRSDRLKNILEKYNYQLDIKMHPIFQMYQSYFGNQSSYIKFITDDICEEEYALFITDFSSYMYNFIYAGAKIINYIPDIIEFKSGMNGYRNLNYPDSFWDGVVYEADDLINQIQKFMEGKLNSFSYCHFFQLLNCREKIYEEILDR